MLVKISIVIHVLAGISAILSGAIAFTLRKKTERHKPFGKIYFAMMTIVFITGVFLSVAKSLLFFFFIATLTYYNTVVAYRALKLKRLHIDQRPSRFDWIVHSLASIAFTAFICYGIIGFLRSGYGGNIISIAFGAIGLFVVFRNSSVLIKRPLKTNYWLKMHVGNMIGSYIGALTAFLVNQTDKIPLPPIILWLGPTIVIVPLMIREIRLIKSTPLTVDEN